MTSRPVLHLIIPCYNPERGWEKLLVEHFEMMQSAIPEADVKIIIVNDGSEFDSDIGPENIIRSVIRDMQWVSYPKNMGKGFALRKGVEAASGTYYIYTDVNFPYTIESIRAIYDGLVNGADIVVGTRLMEYYQKVPKRRVVISKALKFFIRTFLNSSITDTQCGLKGFNGAGRDIFMKTTLNRFLFDMQFVRLATGEKNITIKEQTVISRPGITFSHMNYAVLLRESFSFLWLILIKK